MLTGGALEAGWQIVTERLLNLPTALALLLRTLPLSGRQGAAGGEAEG